MAFANIFEKWNFHQQNSFLVSYHFRIIRNFIFIFIWMLQFSLWLLFTVTFQLLLQWMLQMTDSLLLWTDRRRTLTSSMNLGTLTASLNAKTTFVNRRMLVFMVKDINESFPVPLISFASYLLLKLLLNFLLISCLMRIFSDPNNFFVFPFVSFSKCNCELI